ncbi:MAG: DUF2147 domain-containing protein [Turneriella sp.]|nr:DUF2147 domain-containing protein [Turneriella sp.]
MLASLVFAAGIYAEEDIEGRWMTIDDETGKPRSYIKIWVENGVAYGSIEKIIPLKPDENTNPRCTECKGEDYNKPVVGMTILRGLRKDGDEWTGGTILDPNNGKTYKCKIKADKNGKTLKVRGYIGFSLIGRTQIWRRAE